MILALVKRSRLALMIPCEIWCRDQVWGQSKEELPLRDLGLAQNSEKARLIQDQKEVVASKEKQVWAGVSIWDRLDWSLTQD